MRYRAMYAPFIMMFLFGSIPLRAQVEQITFGPGSETHPSLSRSMTHSQGEWLVYERRTADSSFIAAKKFFRNVNQWDSTETIIVRSGKDAPLLYPEVSSKPNNAFVAWQQKLAGHWNIHFSTFSTTSGRWSPPAPLTNDTLNNINVRVQGLNPDSQFFVTWQNGRVIRATRYPMLSAGIRDTIAVSNDDSASYDMTTDGYTSGWVMVTVKGANNMYTAVIRRFNISLSDSVSVIDTLSVGKPLYHPRFVQSFLGWNEIIFESPGTGPFTDIYLYRTSLSAITPPPPVLLTKNNAVHGNARGYFMPVVTLKSQEAPYDNIPYNHIAITQVNKNGNGLLSHDSSYLKIISSRGTDTIISAGYDREPVVGASPSYMFGGNSGVYVPVVWESDRAGSTHLFGSIAWVGVITAVPPAGTMPLGFGLEQNYPNPFNPTTAIRYQLSAEGPVKLTIIDALGRSITTLVNAHQDAGAHSVSWNASRFASGTYFARLQAGDRIAERKMLLIK